MYTKIFADAELLKVIPVKVKTEREATAAVLELLAEIDSRKLYLKEGYRSMYSYLTTELSYSEGAAQRRIKCARALNKTPKVKDMLNKGDISLTTLSMVSGEIGTKPEILKDISGKNKRQVEKIILKDKPASNKTRESIKTIKVNVEEAEASLFDSANQGFENHRHQNQKTEARLKLSFSILEDKQELIDEAKRVLSGKLPRGASLEELFVAGLESLVNEHRQKAKSLGSRKSRGSKKGSRHIPAKIRKEVLERDGHTCTYVSESGKACGCKWDLELDHVIPFADGGEHTADNLRVLCRAHNQYLAEKRFGRVWEAT